MRSRELFARSELELLGNVARAAVKKWAADQVLASRMLWIQLMKIRDIMRSEPLTINETDTLGAAQQIMKRNQIRHLPVMTGGKLVGILSERDVLAARANAVGEEWWKISVHDAMRSPVHTANPDDSLTEVAARLAMSKIGALPVIELGKLVGIVTVTDVLDAEVRAAMAPSAPATRTGYAT